MRSSPLCSQMRGNPQVGKQSQLSADNPGVIARWALLRIARYTSNQRGLLMRDSRYRWTGSKNFSPIFGNRSLEIVAHDCFLWRYTTQAEIDRKSTRLNSSH